MIILCRYVTLLFLLVCLLAGSAVPALASEPLSTVSEEDTHPIIKTSADKEEAAAPSPSTGAIVFTTLDAKKWNFKQEDLVDIGARNNLHDSGCLSNAIVNDYPTKKKNFFSTFRGRIAKAVNKNKKKEEISQDTLNHQKNQVTAIKGTSQEDKKKKNIVSRRATKIDRNLGKKQGSGKKNSCPITENVCKGGCTTSYYYGCYGPRNFQRVTIGKKGDLNVFARCQSSYVQVRRCVPRCTGTGYYCNLLTCDSADNGCSYIKSNGFGTTYLTSRCTCSDYTATDTSCSAADDIFPLPQCDTNRRKLSKDSDKYDDPPDLDVPFKKDKTMIGFVRVPKTGSTTLLKFLHLAKRMYPWDRHLPSIKEEQDEENDIGKNRGNGVAGCIYGYAPSKAHLGTKKQTTWWNRCPHIPYGKMVAQWASTLPKWTPPEAAEATPAIQEDDKPYTMSFEAISILRDPFDRLVSYFYYLRKFKDTNQFLDHTVTEAQYERVKENDLEGWMELLHEADGGCGLELPYQYKYIHEDVDKAISLVKGDSPRVYTLLTECYAASLWLLAEKFEGIESDSVDAFITSEDYMSNSNYESSKGDRPSKDALLNLRSKAEFWFADDYKFYDIVVEEFKLKMAKSGAEASKFESCMHWKKDP